MLTPEQVEAIKGELISLSPEDQQKKLKEIISKLSPEEREQLVGKQQCPFCLMVEGKIPTRKVFEDDKVLAVLDINPANEGHTILFPKNHFDSLQEIPESITQNLFSVANKISKALIEANLCDSTNIIINNGASAGQTSPHILINIIPRNEKDKVSIGWDHQKISDSKMDSALDLIKKKIPKEKPKEIKKSSYIDSHPRIP
ncbi:HIT domain-containing protein [Candidatus Woesearchaeota archaeon]|nr:HIT domain-containing protein [Candidatus Woesearchaeota archaeon]